MTSVIMLSHGRLRILWLPLYMILLAFVSVFDHVYGKQKPFTHEAFDFLLFSSPEINIHAWVIIRANKLYCHVLVTAGTPNLQKHCRLSVLVLRRPCANFSIQQ